MSDEVNALNDNSGAVDGLGTMRPPASETLENRDRAHRSHSEPPPPSVHGIRYAHMATVIVAVQQRFVGEVPGGFRVDLTYSTGGKPAAAADLPDPIRNLLTNAEILSGSDWVTVSNDGVIDFDSRITMAFTQVFKRPAGDVAVRVPVSGRLRGRASLRDARKPDHTRLFRSDERSTQIMNRWEKGFPARSYLPLVLAVGFDIPGEGFTPDETAVYNAIRNAGLGYSLYVGCGKALFDGSENGGVDSITLDLFTVAAVTESTDDGTAGPVS